MRVLEENIKCDQSLATNENDDHIYASAYVYVSNKYTKYILINSK